MRDDQTIPSIGKSFFDYLGTSLPHLCASDEFYFLPRSEKAVSRLAALDDLRPERLREVVRNVERLANALPQAKRDDEEEQIDRATLKKSMERFLWQFGALPVWQQDPTLYVKIPLFAVDEIMSRDTPCSQEWRDAFSDILGSIGTFLERGLSNLANPSALSLDVAARMASDAMRFFERDVPLFIHERADQDQQLLDKSRRAQGAWSMFGEGLRQMKPGGSFRVGEKGLAEILAKGVDCPHSPAEVLEMAEEGFRGTLARIKSLADKIDPQTPWQDQVRDRDSGPRSEADILESYHIEVRNLREFFSSQKFLTFPEDEVVEVRQTPSYLQSLRATASYRATLTGRPEGHGVFYVTPGPALSGLALSHKPYLSAHETYPGHHVLDTIRVRHPNPIRRQIESPLFYEGWATYAEFLLDDCGYTTHPRQRLVQLQRQLWRDLRAVLDVKLQTGAVSEDDAIKEIQAIGFSVDTAARQVRRFALTPGYQSCYFLGAREIMRLRGRFSDSLGLRAFHDRLLAGGQLSFDLVEKRLKAAES